MPKSSLAMRMPASPELWNVVIVDRPAFEGGLWWAGQVHGAIDSVDRCQNIGEEIV